MLGRFKDFVRDEALFESGEKVLLAVSGGLDSVALSHLMARSGFEFGIAHCNFKLRAQDADKDENFTRQLASQLEVPFFYTSFETEAIAKSEKQSIQLVARNLRYAWLESIRLEKGYKYIATAHHLNDSIETFFLNFTKGCGIRGLHGIPLKNRQIVRPLLFATRKDLENYVQENDLEFRNDLSNASLKYDRNKIRLQIIDVLKEINPAFENTAAENFKRIKEVEWLYKWAVKHIRADLCKKEDKQLKISRQALNQTEAPVSILYEILADYGFNTSQVSQMIEIEKHQVGAMFHSNSHRLLVDRLHFILEIEAADEGNLPYTIKKEDNKLELPDGILSLKTIKGNMDLFVKNRLVAVLDFEKLTFPLKLRHWRDGDFFFPLGMEGKKKKLKHFFSDLKLSRFQKEKIWLLETAKGEICWVVNYRPDDRFKISSGTKRYLVLTFKKF